MLAEECCDIEEGLAAAVTYCVSRKNIRGTVHVYKQWTENGEKKQEYVQDADAADVIAKYEEKKKLKARKRELDAQIAAMSRGERKKVREEIRLCRKMRELDKKCDVSQMPNGDARDSADELAISLLMDMLGVIYQYNCPIPTRAARRRADFIVNGKVWEHMGMKGVPEYDWRQELKLLEYHDIGLIEGMNLIITERTLDKNSNKRYLKLPRILWHMVKNGLVDAHTVRRVFRL